MGASSPCFYELVVICRALIFRLFFATQALSFLVALLLQLSSSLKGSSFQNLPKTQSGVGCNAGPYFRAALTSENGW
jgi:hypothetical protein